VQPRDCYGYLFSNLEDDGSLTLVICDDPDSEQPVQSGITRCHLNGLIKIKPLKEDPSKSQLDYMCSVDFKGNVPTFVITQSLALVGMSLCTGVDMLPKWVEQNKQRMLDNPAIEQQKELEDK
jgi:hypothetical protein